MNNSRRGGSVPINRLLKKPNPALNKETNSHPEKSQTLAQPLLNLLSPERGSQMAAAARGAVPAPFPEHPGAVPAPHAGTGSTATGNHAGVAGGSGTEAP